MKDKRFLIGVCVTAVWLAFTVCMFVTREHPGKLNERGDFFAGFFAPMAFFWLVLGYMQQGEELKHSTEALRLQAAELKNSVEQQSQLVAVSREQVQQELRALEEERERRRDAVRPKFAPHHAGTMTSGGVSDFKLNIVNVGNTATNVHMRFDPALEKPSTGIGTALLARDGTLTTDLRFALTSPSTARITYVDADGMPGEVEFSVQVVDRSLVVGQVARVL